MNVPLDLIRHMDQLKITNETDGKPYFFDPIRKKKIRVMPEEFVRQLCLYYMIHVVGYPQSRIQVEKTLLINGVKRRFDIILYDKDIKPFMLVECKSVKIKMDQTVFDQIALYNLKSNAPYLWVTNGDINYICNIDPNKKEGYQFLDSLPLYSK